MAIVSPNAKRITVHQTWPATAPNDSPSLTEQAPGTKSNTEVLLLETLRLLDQTRTALHEAILEVRGSSEAAHRQDRAFYFVGQLTVDTISCRVTLDGKKLPLSPTEFRVLALLAEHIGEAVTYEEFASVVWHGGSDMMSPEMVRTCVWRIRKKLRQDGNHPEYIVLVPRVGYRLRNQEQWQTADHQW